MRILYLTPWYPSARDAMLGLFVQKHVECVRAQGEDVRVISSQGLLASWRQWRQLRREGWQPDVVQLNVIQKQGLLAMWLRWRYKIPYIIVEHWSGYLPQNGQYRHSSAIHRRMAECIVRHAQQVLTVSQKLADSMQACGLRHPHYELIHNVVDDFFYSRKTRDESRESRDESRESRVKSRESRDESRESRVKRLLHISCFDEHAKNVKGLLSAAKALSKKRQDWRLVLVGTGVDYTSVRAFARDLDIPNDLLVWRGELPPREVAKELQQADAFVLFSNYENAPVVISESLASGVPVVASAVGGIPEMVPSTCGELVPAGDETALEEALMRMLDHYQDYDPDAIRREGERYSFEAVGKKLCQIYHNCLCMDFSAHTK